MALSNSKARKKIVLPPTFIFTSSPYAVRSGEVNYTGPLPSKTEATARRLLAEIYRATDGRPQRWCTPCDVYERTGADEQAGAARRVKGWINLEPKQGPALGRTLDAGRRLVE